MEKYSMAGLSRPRFRLAAKRPSVFAFLAVGSVKVLFGQNATTVCRGFRPLWFATRLGGATLFNVFRPFVILAIGGVAALTGIVLGRILRVVYIAAPRRILLGVSCVSGIALVALARVLLIPFGLVCDEFLL